MWQILLTIGIISLILEILVPSMFFLNFALSAFLCAVLAYYIPSITIVTIAFCALSLITILVLRPILLGLQNRIKDKTGMEDNYIGKTVPVIEDITKDSGAISIYDERWQARVDSDEVIRIGEKVEIIGYESIIMKVKKVV